MRISLKYIVKIVKMQVYEVACFVLFAVELYHFIAHVMILCGLRTLPRKDFVRIRLYFLIDGLSVFLSSFMLTHRLQWLASLQVIQHIFIYTTWDKSTTAKRVSKYV